MAFEDRIVEYPNRYRMTVDAEGFYTLERAEGNVAVEGTPLNATNLNFEIQRMISESMKDLDIQPNGNVNYRNLQSGSTLVKVTAAKEVMTQRVNFPQAFTGTPRVVVAPLSGTPQNFSVSVGSMSATGFTIYLYGTVKRDTTVYWIATL